MSELGMPTLSQVKERLAGLRTTCDSQISAINETAKADKETARKESKEALATAVADIDKTAKEKREKVRKAFREAEVKWNRVLRSLQADADAGSATKPDVPDDRSESSPD